MAAQPRQEELLEGGHDVFYEGLDGVEVEGGAEGDVEVGGAYVYVLADAVFDLLGGAEEHSTGLVGWVVGPGGLNVFLFLAGVGFVGAHVEAEVDTTGDGGRVSTLFIAPAVEGPWFLAA